MKKETQAWRGPSPERRALGTSVGRWLDRFFSFELPEPVDHRIFAPPYDLHETAEAYFMTFDLPGTDREDIHVELSGNELVIRGERRALNRTAGEEGLRFPLGAKPRYGKFKRGFTLPSIVDGERVSAAYDNGVLTVLLPKRDGRSGREIPVGTTLPESPRLEVAPGPVRVSEPPFHEPSLEPPSASPPKDERAA
jgi:HSP20 family protein